MDPLEIKERIGRFRILVIGRANAGKITTILQRVCNTRDNPEIYNCTGEKINPAALKASRERVLHDVENEMAFQSNPGFVFHDSRGFEAGGECLTRYCIPMDEASRSFTEGEVKFLSQCDTGSNMDKDGADCRLLIERTAGTLYNEMLQQLFVSTQQTNMELCMNYAVERTLLRLLRSAETTGSEGHEHIIEKVGAWFPHIMAVRLFILSGVLIKVIAHCSQPYVSVLILIRARAMLMEVVIHCSQNDANSLSTVRIMLIDVISHCSQDVPLPTVRSLSSKDHDVVVGKLGAWFPNIWTVRVLTLRKPDQALLTNGIADPLTASHLMALTLMLMIQNTAFFVLKRHSEVPTKDEDWPTLGTILAFRDRVRARLLALYDDLASGKRKINRNIGRMLAMTLEHEGWHVEVTWETLSAQWDASCTPPSSRTVTLGPVAITLGHHDCEGNDFDEGVCDQVGGHEFGWDNDNESPSSEDEGLRGAAYDLLGVLSSYLNYDKNPIIVSKAGFAPKLTLDFISVISAGMDKATAAQRITCLQYMSPWVKNLAKFCNPTNSLYEHSGARLRDCVRSLIDLTISDLEASPDRVAKINSMIHKHIWVEIGRQESTLVYIVLEELIRAASDGGIGSRRCETIDVRGRIFSKLRKVLGKTALKPSKTLPENVHWNEIATLARFALVASNHSKQAAYDQLYIPDIFHIVTLIAGTGQTLVRKSLYGVIMNFLHEYCNYDPDKAMIDSQESLTRLLVRVMEVTSGSRGLFNIWRARWMSLATSTAFQLPAAIQSRAFLVLGTLATSDVDDDLVYQMLVAFKNALGQSTESDTMAVTLLSSCARQSKRWKSTVPFRAVQYPMYYWTAGFHWKTLFSFTLAAIIFKGVCHNYLRSSAELVLWSLLSVTARCGSASGLCPDALGHFIALLPFCTTHEAYVQLLQDCKGEEFLPAPNSSCSRQNDLVPRVSVELLSLTDSTSAILTVSFASTLLTTAQGDDAETEILYNLLADIGTTYPESVSMMQFFDSYNILQDRIKDAFTNSSNAAIIRAVTSIFRNAQDSLRLGSIHSVSVSTLSTVDEGNPAQSLKQKLKELGMDGLTMSFQFLAPNRSHWSKIAAWISDLILKIVGLE
ncbi:hypothetical protein EV702DRAFT_1246575 [Suillus placidus]|uniref:Uncharacterized protein n=1 Tax=Suillus placidus TaxID=48579 RepID=A0A9P6ZME1_9AGAM|nr:hypothetical protein EV702DRAFT_1246575 [Suillus placidus]